VEADLLLWIHSGSSPALDAVARFSWALGALRFCAPAVLLLVAWHLARRERREALAWSAVGAAAALLPELLKLAVARPRPALWPWLLPTSGYSFPSGHAVAGTALYAARWLGGPRPLTVLSSP
jgi:undecaprenyl-diphosphatase